MFLAWSFYWRASRSPRPGQCSRGSCLAWITRWLHARLGTQSLLWLAVGVFVVAWIAQFVGHTKLFEGRKPSFLTDLKYLLIGPAWVLAVAVSQARHRVVMP